MNLLNKKIKCIECKSTKIIKDFHKKEVYCAKCGLVLVDNEISTLQQRTNQAKYKETPTKNKKTMKNQYLKMRNFFYNFN